MTAPTREEILYRLKYHWEFWSENCAQIIATNGKLVPLVPKPAQLRVWEAAKRQMDAGRPVRLIVPKARKEGVSTFAVSHLVQRATMRENHNCISVAQDRETAGELLQMATMIHANLPDSAEWPIKPPIANKQRRKELAFGNPSRQAQATGDFGINSRLIADTASEFEAGRGFTFHAVHCSEVALWDDIKRKMTALLNAVPDDPETFIILESTSKGFNHWRTLCHQARDGLNDFELVFLPWFEEPQYQIPFKEDRDRQEFIESIGTGPWGEEEPDLVEAFGCTPEQLQWRRWAISNRSMGDLEDFHQEYPATLEQSFLASGANVFSQPLVAKMISAVEREPKPEVGSLEPTRFKQYQAAHGPVQIPLDPRWEAGHGKWRIWVHPVEDAQYVIGADPAGDDSIDKEERAMHAGVVIDHRTREQVAEIEMQGDSDEFALQLYMACLYFNRATIAVETTGSWGAPILRRIRRDWKYMFVYRRKRLTQGGEGADDVLGFDTNRTTKGFLVEAGREMLREGTHGIRSVPLASQFTTYVRDGKSKFGPSPGERADLLMAFLIAQLVADESPIRFQNGRGGGSISTTGNLPVNPKTGY